MTQLCHKAICIIIIISKMSRYDIFVSFRKYIYTGALNETDLRVQRTRRKLKEAMITLIQEEAYETITVLQIVERAGIGHKTFYRHYPDKRALIIAIVNDIFQEILARRVLSISNTDIERNALHLLQVIDQYSDVINRVRAVISLPELAQQLHAASTAELELMGQLLPPSINDNLLPPLELVSYHFVASILQLIDWWLENDKPYPIEQMATYINTLVVYPLFDLKR